METKRNWNWHENWDSENKNQLLCPEVEKAMRELQPSPGHHKIAAESIKKGGEYETYIFYKFCTAIWKNRKWPDDWVKSILFEYPRKMMRINVAKVLQMDYHSTIGRNFRYYVIESNPHALYLLYVMLLKLSIHRQFSVLLLVVIPFINVCS